VEIMAAPGPKKGAPTQEGRSWGGLGEILLREGLVTDSQMTTALQVQKETDKCLGRVLVEMGLLTERVRMRILQQKLGYEIVRINPDRVEQAALDCLPKSVALKHRLVPIRLELDTLVVAMEDPTDVMGVDDVKAITGFRIRPVIATIEEIEAVLQRYPEKAVEEIHVEARPSPWFRILGDAILFTLLAAPLVFFMIYLPTNPELRSHFARPGAAVDVFLFTLLGYGIYAVICFEIWSLIFQRRKSKPSEPPLPPTGLP
jgi:hypothetical protein